MSIPNNISITQSFEEKRDLLTQMAYKRGNTLVSQRVYTYDALGRPLTRQTSRNGQTVNDSFVHTYRSELASAQVNGQTYAYDYDNIGNRRMSIDASDYAFYDANELNQYSSIRKNEESAFVPTFDAAGNQTLVRTATGTWSVTYNAENRPVIFQKTIDSVITRITCSYDYMGRRATKKVEEISTDAEGNESTTVITNHRFIYRGYLQIGCCDLSRSGHPCLWLITWDPTQPVATRPLAIQKDGTWYTYGWDLTKNICEIFGQNGYIRSTYAYTPYGSITISGDVEQPIQWSNEYYDSELALVYYNYRHYNSTDGRWINRDPITEQGGWNLYAFVGNGLNKYDILGQAYLAIRPLYLLYWRTKNGGIEEFVVIRQKIYPKEGLNLYHSHFFFKDGTDIGYFPDGLQSDNDPELRKLYKVQQSNLDDCVLKKAIAATKPKPYSLTRTKIITEKIYYPYQINSMGQIMPLSTHRYITREFEVLSSDTDNCNSWAQRVMKKYNELIKL
ncbi:MAG: RHS repeat-associated core domain-containing protein [Akkermansia sp.]|nr:RHS repeat-associated core domain-containing protein [Akkermansia sp.]